MRAESNVTTPLRPSWVEIDLDAVRHNLDVIRKRVGSRVMIHGVLKGDAYGCGLLRLAWTLKDAGVPALAVGNIHEGIELRRAGIGGRILLFVNTLPSRESAAAILNHDLTPSISDLEMAKALATWAERPREVYLKIDAGWGRLGVPAGSAISFVEALRRDHPLIRVVGIHAHIPWSLSDEAALIQFRSFVDLANRLDHAGFEIPVKMVAGSGIVFRFPEMHLTAVDPGKAVYGFLAPTVPGADELRPAFSVKSRLIHVKEIEHGEGLNPIRIGVIPLGTADGFLSRIAGGSSGIVSGHRAPVVELSDAEHTRLDLSGVPHASVGDEVTLIGRQGQEEITLFDVAEHSGLKPTEITRGFSNRLPYYFFEKGQLSGIRPVASAPAELGAAVAS